MRKYFVIIATALILSACSSEKKKENKTQNTPRCKNTVMSISL